MKTKEDKLWRTLQRAQIGSSYLLIRNAETVKKQLSISFLEIMKSHLHDPACFQLISAYQASIFR